MECIPSFSVQTVRWCFADMFELLETPDSCSQLTKHGGGVSASLNYAVLRSHPQNCVRRTAQNCAELRRRNGHLCDAPCSFCSPWTLVKTMFEHSSSVHSLRILVGLDPWPCGCARPNKLNQSLTLAYGLPASYDAHGALRGCGSRV